MQRLMRWVADVAPQQDAGGAFMYLGVFESLVPVGMGGQPDKAKANFERAIEISGGRQLMAKVLYARHYARAVYDRELHDRLLKEVLEADPHAPGMTLVNVLAQREAAKLQADADDYF